MRLDKTRTAVIIVSAGVVLRLALLSYLGRLPLVSDSLTYHTMALGILHGTAFDVFYPPGLPLVLAAVYRVLGPGELIARVAALFWYAGLSVVVFQLGREVFSRKTANLALLVLAVYPTFIWRSVEPLSHLPAATCIAAACLLALRIRRQPRVWAMALLGGVLGLLVLIRPSSLSLVALVAVYLGVALRRRWMAAIPVVVCVLFVSAWLVKADRMLGRFVMINEANTVNLFLGNNPYTPLYRTWWFGSHNEGETGVPPEFSAMYKEIQSEPKEVQRQKYLDVVVHHVASRPDLFLVRSLSRLRTFFAFDTMAGSALREYYGVSTVIALLVIAADAFVYVLILFGAVAFLFLIPDRTMLRGAVGAMLLFALVYAAPYWLAFSHPTYHVPILPLLAIIAAALVEGPAPDWRSALGRRFAALSTRRRVGLIFTTAFILYIQAEWFVFGLSRI